MAGDVYIYYDNGSSQSIVGVVSPGGKAGHVGIQLSNGDILTSRPGQGVIIDPRGTLEGKSFSIIRAADPVNEEALESFAESVLGSGYDYGAIIGLGSSNRFTCAEVVSEGLNAGGISLDDMGYVIEPNDIANDPAFNQSVMSPEERAEIQDRIDGENSISHPISYGHAE